MSQGMSTATTLSAHVWQRLGLPLFRRDQQVQGCGRHLSEAIRLSVAFGKAVREADVWLGKTPQVELDPRYFLGLNPGLQQRIC